MPSNSYDGSFFDYNDGISAKSAQRIIPIVQSLIPGIESVADFGCARGIWLRVWGECGVHNYCGLDGDYIDKRSLHISPEVFITHDFTLPASIDRRFDIVQSLEVAEHLPESAAKGFVQSLTRHSDIVLFSAAAPGQGGAHHINERPYEFWRDIFAEHGYRLFDCLRPRIRNEKKLQAWYRFNSFIYVNEEKLNMLSSEVRSTEIPPCMPIPDISPLSYRLRKGVIKTLPFTVQNALARLASKWQRYQ